MTAPLILTPLEAVQQFLFTVVKPVRLLVAVSGGSDSAGLLLGLSRAAASEPGVSLLAATIDHALRPEAAREARAVAGMCARLGIEHTIRRWDDEKPKTGISAAAREARYGLLMQVADECEANVILTGHTLDDQAETVAMRQLRSADENNTGLAGMAEAALLDRRRWLVRPFLRTRRADIRAFLQAEGEVWIDDPSNSDPHYERVRVRRQLETAGVFDAAALQRAPQRRTAVSDDAAALLHEHATIDQGVLGRLAPPALKQDPAVLRRALSSMAAVLGGRSYGVSGDRMDRVLAVVRAGHPVRITSGRVIFELREEGLYILRERRGLATTHVGPGETAIWDGRYRITNDGTAAIDVEPARAIRGRAIELFPDVPPALAARAMAVMPAVSEAAGTGTAERADAGVRLARGLAELRTEPVLGPFDRFLPQFDLKLASEFAVLLGCDAFPRLPIKDSVRKS